VFVLDGLCRLMHPIMPFVTEQVWQALGQAAPRRHDPATLEVLPASASVCIAPWPSYPANFTEFPVEATVAQWQEKITVLRNLRAERNVPSAARINPIIVARGEVAEPLRAGMAHIRNLAGAETVRIVEAAERPAEAAVAVLADAEVILPLEGLIDKQAECAKLRRSLDDLDRQLGPLRAKLGNEAFVSRAPAEVVTAQRAKLAELEARHASVAALIDKDCRG
jgi:valyl-tRNA synthetase